MNIDEQLEFIDKKVKYFNRINELDGVFDEEVELYKAILSTLKEVKKMRSYANKMNDYLDPRNKGGE